MQRLFEWPDGLVADLVLLSKTPIVTARYTGFRREHGVPVRTTVGAPKYWRSNRQGDLVHFKEMAPYKILGNAALKTDEDQRRAYWMRCEELAVPIVQTMAEIARTHPDQTLCLLCFEDVHKGQQCHRRWFARWFEMRFGLLIPEWTPEAPEAQQLSFDV